MAAMAHGKITATAIHSSSVYHTTIKITSETGICEWCCCVSDAAAARCCGGLHTAAGCRAWHTYRLAACEWWQQWQRSVISLDRSRSEAKVPLMIVLGIPHLMLTSYLSAQVVDLVAAICSHGSLIVLETVALKSVCCKLKSQHANHKHSRQLLTTQTFANEQSIDN